MECPGMSKFLCDKIKEKGSGGKQEYKREGGREVARLKRFS